jgi:hypothetical protein
MRESRLSGSVEGVSSNPDPYSDSPEPMVVKQPKFTRVEEPTLLCNQWDFRSGQCTRTSRELACHRADF